MWLADSSGMHVGRKVTLTYSPALIQALTLILTLILTLTRTLTPQGDVARPRAARERGGVQHVEPRAPAGKEPLGRGHRAPHRAARAG